MKKKLAIVVAVVLMVGTISMILTGCAIGKPTVNLNDYVTVREDGYDGYGTIYASVDFDAILTDYAKHLTDKSLDTQYFGNQTPELAAEFVFSAYDPYALAYNAGENVKNGDKIEFTWNTNESAIEQLGQILEVKFKYSNFDHKVENLEPLQEVDVFEHVEVDIWGISNEGSVSSYPRAVLKLEDRENDIYFDLTVDTSNNGTLSNGDTVHMSLKSNYDAEYYAENYGLILTRSEADVVIDGFVYYAYDNPAEILEYLGGESVENALAAATDFFKVDSEERMVEYVGALYYYQNEGNEFKYGYNTHNQLLLIYHVNNGKVPGGWYTYLAPYNNVVIGNYETEDGSVVKATMTDVQNPLTDSSFNYQKEVYNSFARYNRPITFEYAGTTYVGHQTIEDCIRAYEANELGRDSRYYDYVTASSNLMSYISVG